jgi:DNA-binding winged helix-turn-helix (wHTH) protein/TolB-like protein/Flp pilus assembly protein TadD
MSNPFNRLYEFEAFHLDPAERLLLCQGHSVPIPPKAFDLLVALVARSGHLVEKEELMKAVWPDSFVEEGNLSVTISLLRKALNDDRGEHKYIETVSKRGYRFIAPVKEVQERDSVQTVQPEHQEIVDQPPPVRMPQPRMVSTLNYIGWKLLTLAAVVIAAMLLFERVALIKGVATGQAKEAASLRSLAVLPFQTLGESGEDQYMGLGMADALITKLGNTGKIIVRPTSTIQKYATFLVSPQAAGREQAVDAVLDGRIQKEADRVRLTVQLIRVQDGVQLWANTFDQKFTNIFALEDEISERVARSIRLELTGEETKRFTKRPTERTDAYEAYIKGRYFWNKRTEEGLQKGLLYFREAIALDSTFAEAYVGVADSYAALGLYAVLPPNEAFPAAIEAGKKALALDDGLAEAHATLGFIYFYYNWNGPAAEKEFRRAFDSNPNYAMAHSWNGENLAAMGRFSEAIAEARQAQEDDPLSLIIGSNAGYTLCLAGQYDLAIQTLTKAIEIDPNFPRTHFRLGCAYEQKAMYEQAISELQKAVRLSGGDPYYEGSLGHAYAASGNSLEARKILELLQKRSRLKYVPAYAIALIYAGLEEKDHALDWLERAYDDRSTSMAFLKVNPLLNNLHSNPRFVALSQRLAF